ncbi:MAG: RNA polymerase sigma factor [Oscillospiraceae bacterium]|nr:RNA polymerase sigma factor [Oscillospiraceae bacterium]
MEADIGRAVPGEVLYRRFLAGDRESFESLVEMYEDGLYAFIYGMVHDHHEARHLTIEAFAELALGSAKYAERSSLKTYLYGIAKNLSRRYLKKRGKEKHISFEEIVEGPEDGGTSGGFVEQSDNKEWVNNAMQCLKGDYRTVLALLYYEDMSYRDAGKVMRKSEGQIKLLAQRARGALKKELINNGYTQ